MAFEPRQNAPLDMSEHEDDTQQFDALYRKITEMDEQYTAFVRYFQEQSRKYQDQVEELRKSLLDWRGRKLRRRELRLRSSDNAEICSSRPEPKHLERHVSPPSPMPAPAQPAATPVATSPSLRRRLLSRSGPVASMSSGGEPAETVAEKPPRGEQRAIRSKKRKAGPGRKETVQRKKSPPGTPQDPLLFPEDLICDALECGRRESERDYVLTTSAPSVISGAVFLKPNPDTEVPTGVQAPGAVMDLGGFEKIAVLVNAQFAVFVRRNVPGTTRALYLYAGTYQLGDYSRYDNWKALPKDVRDLWIDRMCKPDRSGLNALINLGVASGDHQKKAFPLSTIRRLFEETGLHLTSIAVVPVDYDVELYNKLYRAADRADLIGRLPYLSGSEFEPSTSGGGGGGGSGSGRKSRLEERSAEQGQLVFPHYTRRSRNSSGRYGPDHSPL